MTRSRLSMWLAAALLALVTIALYWLATRCDFVNYDDGVYVTANFHVQSGLSWEGAKWAFLNPVSCNWHPLTVLSHMVDCQLSGLKPWGHHLTSVLLHALNVALVFLLLRTLTGALWRSVLVAALFGLHPVHVESVAWVAERKDVLSACFGLLALLFYVRYAKKVASGQWRVSAPSSLDYGLSLFFFALGLMSKAMLVTWPFVMLLLDYWPLRRFGLSTLDHRLSFPVPSVKSVPSVAKSPLAALLLEKIPFFTLAAAASVVTLVVQKHGGAVTMGENLPFGARVGNALVSYCRYLGKMFWPTDLAVFYPHPMHWPMEQVLLAGVLLLGISVLLIAQRRRYPFLLMGWLWYCGTLLPVIGLVQVGEQALADRYTYIPSLGVLILAVWGACELAGRWRYHVIALSVAGTAALILCFGLTRQQIGYWQDSETLFRHALEVTENNYFAHDSLGGAIEKKGQIDEAIIQYQEAIRLKPADAAAHYKFGTALGRKGKTDEAIIQFQEAIRLKPDYAEAYNNLGAAFGMKGQIDEAIGQFEEAIRLKPDYADACNNLGYLWVGRGENLDQARVMLERAVRLEPKNAAFLDTLGWVLFKLNRSREALDYLLKAIENSRRPDAALYDHLGDIYAALNQRDQAVEAWRKSLSVEPNRQIQKKLGDLSAR